MTTHSKRLDGRDEPILDPDIAIVDAHHHLFDKPQQRYMLDEYLEDVRTGHRIVASIYVEAKSFYRADGPELLRPLGEIEFANGVGAMCASGHFGDIRLCAGIVGFADLRNGEQVGELLDRAMACAPERFRGIRQSTMEDSRDAPFRWNFTGRPPGGISRHPRFREGLRQVALRGLTFDATGFHHQLPELSAFADAFDGMKVILNHMTVAAGVELNPDEQAALFTEWRRNLFETARRPNVFCKIGGLGMPMWGFGFQDRQEAVGYRELAEVWRPFVETAIEAFGPERCMMESNFPPDGLSCGFVPCWNALKHIASGYSSDEKAALFNRTASQVYRI